MLATRIPPMSVSSSGIHHGKWWTLWDIISEVDCT
jgi:hypothetical protein